MSPAGAPPRRHLGRRPGGIWVTDDLREADAVARRWVRRRAAAGGTPPSMPVSSSMPSWRCSPALADVRSSW